MPPKSAPRPDRWPVYAIKYRAYGQDIILRVEWAFEPRDHAEMRKTMSVLRAYLREPKNISTDGRSSMSLKELKPTNCVI
ncbi:hypothetical protein LOZ61_006892, partial [Ophidiomyces ophidiicola]